MEENEDVRSDNFVLLNDYVISLYYHAVERAWKFNEWEYMEQFAKDFPVEYKRFTQVHAKRSKVRECYEAMKVLSSEVYFGTLTFNTIKNNNKEECKRKEVWNKMEDVFEYLLVVEEYGENNGRYHIHFLGVFKEDQNFQSFVEAWKESRQNIERVRSSDKVCKYLVKYLSKDLPRIRRNKRLVRLCKVYHKSKVLRRNFPKCPEFAADFMIRNELAFIKGT